MERLLITKVKRLDATTADLFGRRHRYPDLRLFDLADLAEAGIPFEELPIGEEVPCRFWAVWEASEKLNKAGNPYKDIIALEGINKPATATSVDNSAIVGELRAIKALLGALVEAQGLQVPQGDPGGDGDGADVGEEHAQEQAASGELEESSELEEWFPRGREESQAHQVANSPARLLQALAVGEGPPPYQDARALFQALRAELGEGWNWPTDKNLEGWREAEAAAWRTVATARANHGEV